MKKLSKKKRHPTANEMRKKALAGSSFMRELLKVMYEVGNYGSDFKLRIFKTDCHGKPTHVCRPIKLVFKPIATIRTKSEPTIVLDLQDRIDLIRAIARALCEGGK